MAPAGSPASSASTCTGEGCGTLRLPRPVGRGGCVTTAATSKLASGCAAAARRRLSTSAATCGVDMARRGSLQA